MNFKFKNIKKVLITKLFQEKNFKLWERGKPFQVFYKNTPTKISLVQGILKKAKQPILGGSLVMHQKSKIIQVTTQLPLQGQIVLRINNISNHLKKQEFAVIIKTTKILLTENQIKNPKQFFKKINQWFNERLIQKN